MAAAKKKLRAKPNKAAVASASAMGTSGLKQYGGYVFEEFLRDLRGAQGIKKYQEMGSNSAVIGSGLAVGRLLASLAKWKVEPFSAEARDVEVAEAIDSMREDMGHSWEALIRSAFSMIQYGFAPHEIVLKIRDGKMSKYDDGLVGWAQLPLRPQDSLKRWAFDANGRWTAMVQQGQTDLRERTIPRGKLLNFRPRDDKDNPEGISALRYVYFTYYFWKKFQEIEGIGVERSISGLPVMGIPAECMAANATSDLSAVFDAAKEIVQNVRLDSDSGVVKPLAYDGDGNPLYTFELMSASGSSLPDTSKIIERLERRMAQALGTDFMLLGHEGVGSYNLGDSKLDSFEMAVEGYLCLIAEPINQELIPLTLRVNGLDEKRPPKLKHCPLEKADLARLGDFVSKMVSSGAMQADDDLETHLREQADLPPRNPSQKPREIPGGTQTKPEGGAPDNGKPPESKPRKGEEKADTLTLVINNQQPAAEVHTHVAPAAVTVNNDVQPTPVTVEGASVTVQNDVQPAPVTVMERAGSRTVEIRRDESGAIVGAEIEEK